MHSFSLLDRQIPDMHYSCFHSINWKIKKKKKNKRIIIESIHQIITIIINKWKRFHMRVHGYLVLNVVNLILPFIYIESNISYRLFSYISFNHIDLMGSCPVFILFVSSFLLRILPLKLRLYLNLKRHAGERPNEPNYDWSKFEFFSIFNWTFKRIFGCS